MNRTGYILHVSFIFAAICVIVSTQDGYKFLTLENPDLCSEVIERKVKLDDSKPGLIVTEMRFNNHHLPWTSNFMCRFEVKTMAKHNGIVAVVQKMSFRKNESTGECIDFLQFRANNNGATSRKLCGKFIAQVAMNTLYMPGFSISEDTLNNTYDDGAGRLHVNIFISKEPLREYEEQDIIIVFTSYKNCNFHSANYFRCTDESRICIPYMFVKDDYINCPYLDCVDEQGCVFKEEDTKESIGNKVLIGSVTSLFLIFVIFIVCLYICRKHRALCWSNDFARPTTPQGQTSRVIEMNESPQQPETIQATVPPVSSAENQADKDLPPSYDSLFPTR